MNQIDYSLFIEIKSLEDENDFILSDPCPCSDHPWALKEKNVNKTENGWDYFTRGVFCNICGSSSNYYFKAPSNVDQPEETEEKHREVHYGFAHKVIPRIFFDDPEGFIDILKGELALERLLHVWSQYDLEMQEYGDRPLPADGMDVDIIKIKAFEGVLITMPEAKFQVEACFIACLFSKENSTFRYFVFEFTNSIDDEGIAVLCEWMPGKRRRNFERKGKISVDVFLSLIQIQLDDEEFRLGANARSVGVPTWDMVKESDPGLAFMGNDAYRSHICLFAFHIVPDIFNDIQLEGLDEYSLATMLQNAWENLGKICEDVGYTLIPYNGTELKIGKYKGEDFLLMKFPIPLSPPEPYFLAVKISRAEEIYFLEKNANSGETALFTSILSGSHAIFCEVEYASENSFFMAIDGSVRKEISQSILPQLTYYADINSKFEEIFGEI